MSEEQILLIDTEDAKGLVYKVTQVVYHHSLNIERNDEFVDKEQNRFFMRTQISGQVNREAFIKDVMAVLPQSASVKLIPNTLKKIIILVTKESHCVGDLLIRYFSGELNATILGVVGNHDTLRPLVEKFDLPFHLVSSDGLTREEHEEKMISKINEFSPDVIVLAKYMRILTPRFVGEFEGKIINIHHSFLPAFIGANPYKQAHERGVKIIGATAHFVNNHLDEGPIIAQDIIRVDHTQTWEDMRNSGRDVEKVVLSRALKYVLEDKIFVHNNKTIIF